MASRTKSVCKQSTCWFKSPVCKIVDCWLLFSTWQSTDTVGQLVGTSEFNSESNEIQLVFIWVSELFRDTVNLRGPWAHDWPRSGCCWKSLWELEEISHKKTAGIKRLMWCRSKDRLTSSDRVITSSPHKTGELCSPSSENGSIQNALNTWRALWQTMTSIFFPESWPLLTLTTQLMTQKWVMGLNHKSSNVV